MRKKIVTLLIAVLGCCSAMAACDFSQSESSNNSQESSSPIENESQGGSSEDGSSDDNSSFEQHQHSFGTVYSYDETKHWIECECGEADATTEMSHVLTGAKNDTHHWEECECGYKTTEVSHVLTGAKNDTHHWEECECGYKTAEVTHVLTGAKNDTHHWEECECGYKTAEAEHSGGTATCVSVAQCTICETPYGELGNHSWTVVEEDVKSQCENCQAVIEKVSTLVYAEGANSAVVLTYAGFVAEDGYTITIKDAAGEVVASKTVTVSEAGKLSAELGALTAGKTYSIVCEKEKVTLEYTNVMAVTSVIYDMDDFAALFISAEGSEYYTTGASGYYVLANDIDASEYTLTHTKADRWGSGLTGTFDGRGHTIDGVTVSNGGLFNHIKGGMVKDVCFTNMKFTGSEAYGIAKYINTATIENVFIEVTQLTTAWNQAAIAYRADNSNALNDVTIEMLDTDATAFAIGGSSSMAVCKCKNVYVVSNNGLITDATAPEGITQVTWTLEAAEKQIYTINKDEYSNTTTYVAAFNKGSEAQAIVWKSSNEEVATVVDGVITAVAEGTTTISVEYTDSVLNKTYTFVLADLVVSVPTITYATDVSITVATATENTLTAADIAPDDTEFAIASIVDNNGVALGYENGVVTIPETVEVGQEYTWTVSNGEYAYTIKAFVATNVIKTTADLDAFFNYSMSKDYYKTGSNGYYALAGDIDASAYTHAHGKTDSSGVGLTGTFDGRGHSIDGITLTNAGLFGFVNGGTIKNLALTNVKVASTGEAYVITRQSSGMTVDNVFVSVEYTTDSASWNQGLFEKAWGAVTVSNVMVVATGGNANAFALGAMYASGKPENYTYTNVYAISALGAVRVGSSEGITLYADVDTFKANVTTSNLTNFNEYWNLQGDYPIFKDKN